PAGQDVVARAAVELGRDVDTGVDGDDVIAVAGLDQNAGDAVAAAGGEGLTGQIVGQDDVVAAREVDGDGVVGEGADDGEDVVDDGGAYAGDHRIDVNGDRVAGGVGAVFVSGGGGDGVVVGAGSEHVGDAGGIAGDRLDIAVAPCDGPTGNRIGTGVGVREVEGVGRAGVDR